MIIESPIFNDLFIWSFRITKNGKAAQVKSVNTLIARFSSENVTLGMGRISTSLHVCNNDWNVFRIALSLDVEDINSLYWSTLSQQSNDQTKGWDDQESHKNIDEVAHGPSSLVNKAQNEDTHGDLYKASADDESNPFNEGPFDELG